MAEIFISYARGDRAKIEMLAAALKADGFSVWWDRDIHGGAQFTSEIGRQLAEAETVVVAWSATAMASEWVLDEAAQARDDGKLIPITLDNTPPPLGFRQRQAIDFSKWKGAASAEEFIVLKNSMARIKDGEDSVDITPLPLAKASRFRPSPIVLSALAAGVVLVAAIGFFTLRGLGNTQAGQTASKETNAAQARQYERSAFALAPIEVHDDSSQAAQFARGLKNELERMLATNLLTVIKANDATEDSPRAEFLVETSVNRNENNFAVDVDVTHTPSGTKAWSFKSERSVEEANQFRKQNAILITRIFKCAMEDYRARMDGTDDPKIINVVMRLCEAIRTDGPHWRQLPTISRELLELAPNSGLAHATYANSLAFSTWWGQAPEELEKLQLDIREHALKALELKPGVGEAYFALSTLVDGDLSLIERERLLRQGLERDPDFYLGRGGLGNFLAGVGRVQEARSHLRQNVDRDPLNSLRSIHLAQITAATGDTSRANQLLRDNVEQFPEAWRGVWYWFQLVFWHGSRDSREDLKKLLVMLAELEIFATPDMGRSCIYPVFDAVEAGETLSIENLEELCDADLRPLPVHTPTIYAQFGHLDEAFAALELEKEHLKAPHAIYERKDAIFTLEAAPLRADPRFMDFAAEIGLVDYWIEAGVWPDFCEMEDISYDCEETAIAALQSVKSAP